MKSTLLLLGVAGAALASSHGNMYRRHAHHIQKRGTEVVTVTEVVCELNGKTLKNEDCQKGIDEGSLKWADDGPKAYRPFSTASAPVAQKSALVQAEKQPSIPSGSTKSAAQSLPKTSSFSDDSSASVPFESGKLSCSEFPSAYGAVPIDYLGVGGWLSIQNPGGLMKRGAGYTNIRTSVGGGCDEGSYCSYACPSGYFKSQWPTTQGSTGQSVGGLLCKGGKLTATNPAYNTLCIKGSQKVRAYVENKLSQVVSICQTNYPGDESMTIPLEVQPGQRLPLAVLESAGYYKTQSNAHTTAQYYINPAGVPAEKACRWDGADTGNWAPMNIGTGFDGSTGYLSLFSNAPTQQTATLKYKITLEGDVSLPCKYENGQVCRGKNFETCEAASGSAQAHGCTTGVQPGGSMTYVLS